MFQLRCCGAKSPEDWNSSQWRLKVWSETIEAVPASCCKTNTTSQCGLRIHPSSIAFKRNSGTSKAQTSQADTLPSFLTGFG